MLLASRKKLSVPSGMHSMSASPVMIRKGLCVVVVVVVVVVLVLVHTPSVLDREDTPFQIRTEKSRLRSQPKRYKKHRTETIYIKLIC